jgi:hypothetical protein
MVNDKVEWYKVTFKAGHSVNVGNEIAESLMRLIETNTSSSLYLECADEDGNFAVINVLDISLIEPIYPEIECIESDLNNLTSLNTAWEITEQGILKFLKDNGIDAGITRKHNDGIIEVGFPYKKHSDNLDRGTISFYDADYKEASYSFAVSLVKCAIVDYVERIIGGQDEV